MTSTFGEGSRFPTMNDARDALLNHIANRGESYVVDKSERERYTVRCRAGAACPFYVRIGWRRKEQKACVSVYRPHTCSPDTHQNWSRTSSVRYLAAKHRDSFLANRGLKPKDIQAVELLEGNSVSTAQAWRALKALENDPSLGDQLELVAAGGTTSQEPEANGGMHQIQTANAVTTSFSPATSGSTPDMQRFSAQAAAALANTANTVQILHAVLGNEAALSMLSSSDNRDELRQRVQDGLARLRGELVAHQDLGKLKTEKVLSLFSLRILDETGDMPVWKVDEEEPDVMIEMSQWFESYWTMCRMNYSRTSGITATRGGIDIFLVEALRIAKEVSSAPGVYQSLRVFPEATMKYRCPTTKIEYVGHVDHSIGGRQPEDSNSFYSFTSVCEAKGDLNNALDRLLAYLGCMRIYRLRKQRKDLELHGIATDGFEWAFVRVAGNGHVFFSRKYNARSKEERLAIMRSIVHVVRAAFNQLEGFNVYGETDDILSETGPSLPRPVNPENESNS